jgi:predicted DNA binding CopG/RHH family protein
MDPKKFRVTPDAKISDIDLDAEEFLPPEGTRLTETRAEQLSAEQDRRIANLTPGRKSLSGGARHSPVVQLRLSESTRDELATRAAARGVSLSKYTRELIEQSLRAS